jgi:hypothetical protein
VVLTFNAPPTAAITQTGNVLSTPAVAGATYQWFFNFQAVAGATNPSYTMTASGNYRVQVSVNGFGCFANAQANFQVVSVAPSISHLIKLYPNPSAGVVHLELTEGFEQSMTYAVTNTLGQEVAAGNINEAKTVLHLPKGLYFVKIQNREGVAVKQVVVQ